MIRVARQRSGAPRSKDDLVAHATCLCRWALEASSLDEMIQELWGIESAAFSFFDSHPGQPGCLKAMGLPFEAGPPAHCGMAMAIVMATGFDFKQIRERIEESADSRFIDFSYETIGLMLAAYQGGLFGGALRLLGRLGVMRCRPLARPRVKDCFSVFSESQMRLLAHGYGRLLYFKELNLKRALAQAIQVPQLAPEAVVAGAVSAYALINSRDLELLIKLNSGGRVEPFVADGFERGLANTLLLLAWTKPGSLDSLGSDSECSASLMSDSVRLADAARAENKGPPLIA